MDKTILKNFATYARDKLIRDTTNKASMIGITEEGIQDPLSESTSDMLAFDIKAVETYKIYGKEVKQYKRLVEELKKREKNDDYKTAYNTLIEEVAYTWFNRLIAIRFMEVNNYMPDKMRVLSSGREGVNEPEFVTHYEETSLDFSVEELDQLSNWKINGSGPSMDKMFHLLFIKQCNALSDNLPELFEKTDDYAELLLTRSYNDPDGVLYKLVHDIPEEYFDIDSENCNGQVEIIGWMYQYYNTVKKEEVINVIWKNTIKKQDIPAATQIFTTDWVVRYMVDNSLGKYWLERNPESSIRNSLEYLMPGELPVVNEKISPEDIKLFDNAMGSGHCLSYAFDVLLMIYESEGYTSREASKLIVEKNLYGLDIDKRAYQLAYFSIMMKVRQYNRKALNGKLKINLAVFEDSTDINKEHLNILGLSMDSKKRQEALNQINYLIDEFKNATEIGSILNLEDIDIALIMEFINDYPIVEQISWEEANIDGTQEQLIRFVKAADMLTMKYDVMVTNPPYLNKFSPKLKKYINDNYNDYKGDIFSVFIYHNIEMCKSNGYSAYMSPLVWMFIKTYEKLRKHIIEDKHISSLIQMEYSAFEEATVPICTFVLQNSKSKGKGNYIRLSDFTGGMEVQRVKTLKAIENPQCGYYYETEQNNFKRIPDTPIAYWVSENFINCFEYPLIGDIYDVKQGMTTADNNRFLRLWSEIYDFKIGYSCGNTNEAKDSKKKWFPYNKGGSYRKWYGNNAYVVNYENDGREMKEFTSKLPQGTWVRLKSREFYFKESITWTFISSSNFGVRYSPKGFIFDVAGSSMFPKKDFDYILGFLSTKIAFTFLQVINPTLNYQIKDVKSLPIIFQDNSKEKIALLVQQNISISIIDWDSFETSSDFKIHPFLDIEKQTQVPNTIEQAYKNWKAFANSNFNQLKDNEEELNRIFIEIYGLEDELSPEISDKDITITKIFDSKDEIYEDIKGNGYILTKEDVVKSFISYAVGCMFGRYSLDVEGLAYAGGECDDSKYSTFVPTKDNILLITDEEYFEDDIVNRFVDFVKISFGEDTLHENLEFIGDALGGKGIPKENIRDYFLKNFFKDHCKRYSVTGSGKRPIYWLYDSGKQNGFKALIYMHRYNEDTTGKVRIDYLLNKVQKAYERTIDNLQYDIETNNNPREVAKSEKQLTKITKQLKECKDYDEKIAHLALARIPIDLDDGVKVNYAKVQTDEKGKNLNILAKIK